MPSVDDGGIEQKGKKPSRRNCVRRNCNTLRIRRRAKEGRWRVFWQDSWHLSGHREHAKSRSLPAKLRVKRLRVTNPRSTPKIAGGRLQAVGGKQVQKVSEIPGLEGSLYLLDLEDRDVEIVLRTRARSLDRYSQTQQMGGREWVGWMRRRRQHFVMRTLGTHDAQICVGRCPSG